MIHNDVQNQLALLVKTSATPLIEVAQSPVETPQWVPGARLPAHVIASLPNGRFHVQVEDQTLDMNLPRNTQPGDKLELVYVANSPRLTFALLRDAIRNTPLPSQQVELSTTAKLLGNLVRPAQTTSSPVSPLVQTAPLIPAGQPVLAQPLAAALQQAIVHSGLFYESHQAQWLMGERPLESLLREPQGKLSLLMPQLAMPQAQELKNQAAVVPERPLADPAANTQQASSNAVHSAAKAPVLNQTPLPAVADEIAPATTATALAVSANTAKEPIHPQTTAVVQQQLGMVDNRHLLWQGPVWPGQQMTWEIEEEGRRHAHDEEEKTWHTKLHIDFPVLGGVTAHIALMPAGVKVDFSVMEAASMALMQTESPALLRSLEDAGIQVAGLRVGTSASPDGAAR